MAAPRPGPTRQKIAIYGWSTRTMITYQDIIVRMALSASQSTE